MAGTISATNLILRIRDTLQDTTGVRWLDAELLRYLNDAQREIVNLRPDSSADHSNVQLATGTEQVIPDVGLRLIKVVRNMNAAGGSATGKRVIRIVDREILDTQEPDWHDPTVSGAAAHTTVVKHYIFDEDDPRKFYVYPGVAGNAFVEIVYSRSPTDFANGSSAVSYLDDTYANAIIDHVLYRCYLKDAEFAGNQQRASTHYGLFTASISGGGQVQMALSPNLDAPQAAQTMMAPQPGVV
tara:strand:- start:18507 stop:19232 length:726 start_codon:yes stop_codon:yes gene_type:complete